jgi:hypothetical protein
MPRQPKAATLLRAKAAVSRKYRAEPSGKLRVPVVLFLDREIVEHLVARAIEEQKNFEWLVTEMLEREARGE